MIEILSAPTSSLVSLAVVKQHLSVSDNESDDVLTSLIARASAAVVSYLSFNPLVGSYRLTTEPSAGQALIALSPVPVASVTSVKVSGVALDPSGYSIDKQAGLLKRVTSAGRAREWERCSVIAVEYSAGFSECPPDIQSAVLQLIASDWSARGRDPSLKSISIGSINLNYFTPDALPSIASVAPLLDRYRLPGIG